MPCSVAAVTWRRSSCAKSGCRGSYSGFRSAPFSGFRVRPCRGCCAIRWHRPRCSAGRNAGLLILILAGLAISSLAGAATALVMNLSSNPFVVLEIAFWLLGSLEDRSFRHVMLALPFIVAGAILLWSQRNAFRALSLGEETAQSLGVDVGRLRLTVIAGVALGVGGAVAVSGTIGFIGLVAPHLVRPLIGHDPTRLLFPSAL